MSRILVEQHLTIEHYPLLWILIPCCEGGWTINWVLSICLGETFLCLQKIADGVLTGQIKRFLESEFSGLLLSIEILRRCFVHIEVVVEDV